MPCITINWNQSASQYLRWNNLTGSIDCYMHCIVCAPRVSTIFKVQKKILYFGLVPPIAILTPNRFQRVISQKKKNKFLLKIIIYYFWVEVMRVIIELIYCIVVVFCTLYTYLYGLHQYIGGQDSPSAHEELTFHRSCEINIYRAHPLLCSALGEPSSQKKHHKKNHLCRHEMPVT